MERTWDQVRQIRDFAYDVEDSIDQFLFHVLGTSTSSETCSSPMIGKRDIDGWVKSCRFLNLPRELINSAAEREIDGQVKSCRVLNLVLEFIISKAKEENYVQVLAKRSRKKFVAVSLAFLPNDNLDHTHSAFFFGKANFCSFSALFKLLRVVDMKGAPLESFPQGTLRLCLLRYLSVQNTSIQQIPRSIKKLSLLKTLDLKQTLITQLLNIMLWLHNLRRLLI
ncbi:hypothetical protein CRG98_048322 [Punica granatum]|uniref:Disease resistance R13L4/SHOC-2-like LRR domain-containing protein n=1 Tax=Punica granatum TaxID=22663 RepID=A0A2I0HHU7_PUNGR|nr:hypothetical protein CRG98_048322 [Punica granatum]